MSDPIEVKEFRRRICVAEELAAAGLDIRARPPSCREHPYCIQQVVTELEARAVAAMLQQMRNEGKVERE